MERDTTGDTPRVRRRRLPLIVGLIVAVVAAGWTAVWATARSRLVAEIDGRIAGLAAKGVAIACADRAVGGYPFRMELSCRSPGVEIAGRGLAASAAGLRVVAQIWDPKLILVELDGPGTVVTAGGETGASWRTLRASLRWSGRGAERVSIAAEGLDLTAKPIGRPPLRFTASHAEAHGRPSGEAGSDLDLALSAAAAALRLDGERLGPATSDVAAAATLHDFLPPGPGPALPAFAGRGGRIETTRLELAVGGVALRGRGTLTLDRAGALDGMITLVASGLETLAGGGIKDVGPELTAVLSGFMLLGKGSTDPAMPGRRLEMVIDRGLVRIGRLTLGQMPPLFPAAD